MFKLNSLEEYIFDLIEANNIYTADELTKFAEEVHDKIERCVQDYAFEQDMQDDYVCSY